MATYNLSDKTGIVGAGSSSSSSGGGLTSILQAANVTLASTGTEYKFNLTAGPYTITLPSGTSFASVAGTDALGLGSATLYVDVNPGSTNNIDGYANGDIVRMDYKDFVFKMDRPAGSTTWYWDKQATTTAALATSAAAGLISREQSTLLSTTVSGATTSPTISVRQTRNGAQVNLTFSSSGVLTKNGTAGTLNFPIDVDYRPTSNVYVLQYALSSNTTVALYVITTGGAVIQYGSAGGASIAAGATCGWDSDLTLTYSIR